MPYAGSPLAGVVCLSLFCASVASSAAPALEFAYGVDPLQRLDLYLPAPEHLPAATVLLVHGGGWSSGDKCAAADTALSGKCDFPSPVLAGLRRDLVSRGFAVAAANYRLAPDPESGLAGTRFPGALDDVRAALGWIRGPAGLASGCLPLVALVGESAGANLGALLAVAGEPLEAFVGYGGYYDLTQPPLHPALAARVRNYLGCDPQDCPRRARSASASWRARDRPPAHFPPMLLLHGTEDLFLPPDQALALRGVSPADTTLMVLRGYPHAGPRYAAEPVTSNVYELLENVLRASQPSAPQRLPAQLH